jgi:hypothetical protein
MPLTSRILRIAPKPPNARSDLWAGWVDQSAARWPFAIA